MLKPISLQPLFTIPFRKYQSSKHLDFLRSLAALQVFISHSRTLFFADYGDVANPNLVLRLFYFLTGLGRESVVIFFVLSGFFISASIFKARQSGKWSWQPYLINRLSRLYIVFIPALILGGFWDILGINTFGTGEDSIYGGRHLENSEVTYEISERLNPASFLGNLLFLHGLLVGSFGSNHPVWSLVCEFWYYILFPVIVFGLLGNLSSKVRALLLGIAALILIGVGEKIRFYFLIWLLGTMICLLRQRRLFNWLTIVFACLGLGACLTIARFEATSVPISDLLIGIATAFLVYVLLNDQTAVKEGFYEHSSKLVADFSYSLYLLHLPLLGFIRACLMRHDRWQPDPSHLCLWLLICVAVFLYAYLVSLVTEHKTEQVRRSITAWIS